MAKKKRLPMNFEYGSQGLPGTQKTTFDEIFKGQRRSTLRKTGTHGLKVGDVVEVIAANPRRIGEVKITGIRSVDPSMASELSKTERWKPEFIKNYISKGSFEQISYEPLETSRSKPTALTGTMAEKDDFLKLVENQLELEKSGAPKKSTGPFDLTKYSYKPVQKRNTPVQNRRLIGDFVSPLKKPFDTDILVDQTLKPLKYKTLTGDKEEMSGIRRDSGPVKSKSKKISHKRYIDQNKINVIKAFLSQQIESVSEKVSESTGPSFVYSRDPYGQIMTNKEGKPIKRLLGGSVWEHGRGKFELREKGEFAAYDAWGEQKKSVKNPANASNWVWVPDAGGEVPFSYSMSSTTSQSGEIKHTPWEKIEGFFSEALKKSKERGYHLFQTSKLKKHSKTGKSFDRDIVVSHEAFQEIIKNEVVPMLFAKAKDSSSKFSFGNIDMNTPRKRLEKMQGQVVLGEGGSTLTDDIRSTEVRFGEARGSDDISFDEKVKLGQTGWGEASTHIKGEGFEAGKHRTGSDISEVMHHGKGSLGSGIEFGSTGPQENLPNIVPSEPKHRVIEGQNKKIKAQHILPATKKLPEERLDTTVSKEVLDLPVKETLQSLNEGLKELTSVQHVKAASATGPDPVDINLIHQYTTDDFVGLDENQTVQEEMEQIRQQYNNIVKEHDLGSKAWYQETTKLLQKHQGAQVEQLKKIDPILAYMVSGGSQTQKAIQEYYDSGGSAKNKKLPAIKMRVEGEKAVTVEPSSKAPFPSIQESKKLSVQRTTNPHLHGRELPAWHKTEKEIEKTGQKKAIAKYLSYWGGINKMAEEHLASKGIMSEFVTGPEPVGSVTTQVKDILKASKHPALLKSGDKITTPSEAIVAPEAETIVPQKTTSITVDGKSHVLTHNTNIKPGPRSTQLTLGIDPGEVPEIVSNKPSQITEYPSIAHDPKRPLQDQLDMRKPPSVVSGDVDTKNAFPVKQQGTLDIELVKSKTATALTGDETWMTRQEKLRMAANEGISKVGSSASKVLTSPKLGTLSFGLGVMSTPLQWGLAYKQVQDLNQQEADTHAFADDDPLNPRPVTEEDWKTQFWHRMSGGLTPSVNQLRWQRRIDPGTGVRPDA